MLVNKEKRSKILLPNKQLFFGLFDQKGRNNKQNT